MSNASKSKKQPRPPMRKTRHDPPWYTALRLIAGHYSGWGGRGLMIARLGISQPAFNRWWNQETTPCYRNQQRIITLANELMLEKAFIGETAPMIKAE